MKGFAVTELINAMHDPMHFSCPPATLEQKRYAAMQRGGAHRMALIQAFCLCSWYIRMKDAESISKRSLSAKEQN